MRASSASQMLSPWQPLTPVVLVPPVPVMPATPLPQLTDKVNIQHVSVLCLWIVCLCFAEIMWSAASGKELGEVKLSISFKSEKLFIMVMHIRGLVSVSLCRCADVLHDKTVVSFSTFIEASKHSASTGTAEMEQ